MVWILSSMICESPSSVNLSLMHVYWSPGDKTREFILELAQMRPVNQANDFDVCLYGEFQTDNLDDNVSRIIEGTI